MQQPVPQLSALRLLRSRRSAMFSTMIGWFSPLISIEWPRWCRSLRHDLHHTCTTPLARRDDLIQCRTTPRMLNFTQPRLFVTCLSCSVVATAVLPCRLTSRLTSATTSLRMPRPSDRRLCSHSSAAVTSSAWTSRGISKTRHADRLFAVQLRTENVKIIIV